jgi:hypothetical protein
MMHAIPISRLILAASLLVSPIAAMGTTTASQQPATATQSDAAKTATQTAEKKICKQLPSSSSRLPQRVCLTEKQWKQVDEDSQ